jgi:hypothetical protein
MWRGTGGSVALALAASLVYLVPLAPASADVDPCTTMADNVYHWTSNGTGPQANDWMNPDNWEHGDPVRHDEAPNDNKSLGDPWNPGDGHDTSNTIACIAIAIGDSDVVELDNSFTAFVWVQELHISGDFTVHLKPENSGLLVMDPVLAHKSTLGPDVVIDAQGTFGGWARIESQGTVELKSNPTFPAHLSSEIITGTTYNGLHGKLVVEPAGRLLFSQSGMALSYSYSVELHGVARLSGTAPGQSYLGAGWGTTFDIAPTGRFVIANDGGYYQGFQAGQSTISQLHNEGALVKNGSSGTSVIDAGYSESGTGHVEVVTGTLALPDGNTHTATVKPARTLSTGKCAVRGPEDPCVPTTNPSTDPQSVSFTVPAADLDGAQVRVHENAPLDFTAHADDLESAPARIELRIGSSATDDEYSVEHIDDLGNKDVIAPCVGVGLPAGVTNCVDRAASHGDGTNVYLDIRTTETSRYVCHKVDTDGDGGGEQPPVTPPTILSTTAAWRKPTKPITVTTRMDQSGTVAVSGTITARRLRLPLRIVSGGAAANMDATLFVGFVHKLTARQKRKLKAARKVTAVLTVQVVGPTGLAGTSRTVTLTLPRHRRT